MPKKGGTGIVFLKYTTEKINKTLNPNKWKLKVYNIGGAWCSTPTGATFFLKKKKNKNK